jgi:hypothetical protein
MFHHVPQFVGGDFLETLIVPALHGLALARFLGLRGAHFLAAEGTTPQSLHFWS